jgi:CheY-like chemotaxis protein
LALLVVLVAAVLVVLGVFAWVLLAPLVRFRPEGDEAEGRDQVIPSTVLFGRPVAHPGVRRAVAPQSVVPHPLRVPAPVAAPDEPVVEVRAPAVPRAGRPAPAMPQPPVADVLLVTGDSSLSDSQLAVLAASGCASRCAASATDAVGQLRLRIPDLVLVDVAGAEDGVHLLAALRAWQETESLPIVLFTRIADEEMRRRAAELNATDVVVGPQSVPGLVERALPYWLAGVSVFSATSG